MRRFVEGVDRCQAALFPECLEDWIDEDDPVRVIDVFVEKLDLWFSFYPKSTAAFYHRGPAEALHLRLPQSGPVEPAA